jgi:hypothetical protein
MIDWSHSRRQIIRRQVIDRSHRFSETVDQITIDPIRPGGQVKLRAPLITRLGSAPA